MAIGELLDVPLHELEALARALAGGRLRAPLTEVGLRAEGLHALMPLLDALGVFADLTSLGAAVELACAAGRRECARPRPEIVWSGPEPLDGRARSTAVVLEQVFERAESEVFIAGYAFDKSEALLRPLHTAMAERGVEVSIVLDGSREKVWQALDPEALLEKVVDRFRRKAWKFREPIPSLYYDPRTLTREPSHYDGPMFAPNSMHAKCVIADRRWVLTGSANFTERAHARNIEVGILLDDEEVAEALLFQWRRVMSGGFVCPVEAE